MADKQTTKVLLAAALATVFYYGPPPGVEPRKGIDAIGEAARNLPHDAFRGNPSEMQLDNFVCATADPPRPDCYKRLKPGDESR